MPSEPAKYSRVGRLDFIVILSMIVLLTVVLAVVALREVNKDRRDGRPNLGSSGEVVDSAPPTLHSLSSNKVPPRSVIDEQKKTDVRQEPHFDLATLRSRYDELSKTEYERKQLSEWDTKIAQVSVPSHFDLDTEWKHLLNLVDQLQSMVKETQFIILQKLGDHLYEARERLTLGMDAQDTFILHTSVTNIQSTGQGSLPIKFVKTTSVKINSGFEKEADVYQEVDQGNASEVRLEIIKCALKLGAYLPGHPSGSVTLESYIAALDAKVAESRSPEHRSHLALADWNTNSLILYILLRERLKAEPH